jgi:hypothetical protein
MATLALSLTARADDVKTPDDASSAGAVLDDTMQGPPTAPPERSGWTAGIAVGPGELHILPDDGDEQVSEGAGFSLRFGRALSNSFTFQAITEFVDVGDTTNAMFGGCIQFYLADWFFVRAGGGLTRFKRESAATETGGGDTTDELGVGVLGGIGGEWLQLRDLGLSAELMFMGSRPKNLDLTAINASFMLGVQWF